MVLRLGDECEELHFFSFQFVLHDFKLIVGPAHPLFLLFIGIARTESGTLSPLFRIWGT